MSIQIYIVFAFQIALCIFCAIWYATWFESNDVNLIFKINLLTFFSQSFLAYLDILSDSKDTEYAYNFGTRFGSWLLIFQ